MTQMETFDNPTYRRAGWSDGSLPTDQRRFVSFVTVPKRNRVRSENEGRTIIEPIPYLRIERAGEKDVHMARATEANKAQYPKEWAAYEQNREPIPDGTPLDTLFPGFPEIVATLRFHRVHTVEQLADLGDQGLQAVGLGAREWKTKAEDFLKVASSASGFHQLKRAQEEAEATIQKLQGQVQDLTSRLEQQPESPSFDLAQMQARLAELTAKVEKRGPGRPRKEASDGNG